MFSLAGMKTESTRNSLARIETLDQAVAQGANVRVTCKLCARSRVVPAAPLEGLARLKRLDAVLDIFLEQLADRQATNRVTVFGIAGINLGPDGSGGHFVRCRTGRRIFDLDRARSWSLESNRGFDDWQVKTNNLEYNCG